MADYRRQLRSVVAASAAPHGYTLTLWTAGAVTTHANGLPSAVDAVLLLIGAALAFGLVGIYASGGIRGTLDRTTDRDIQVWGGLHLPSVGASILLTFLLTLVVHGDLAWPLVGFVSTATYFLVVAVQFLLAGVRRGAAVPDEDEPN
ncbi:MAG: hypothetical protein JST33_14315 [Actinobacteria bacterium]|nr:hypothetical protein [Actinomycetota bacterium]